MRGGTRALTHIAGKCEADETSSLYDDCYEGDPDPDTEENRIEFPHCFNWNCCNKPGDAEGCARDYHTPDPRLVGKKR